VTTVLVVVAFAAAYVLIATERVHRVAAALGGAAAMVVLGVVDAQVAFFSEETGVDWNVIFLLLGMMVIVGVLRRTGVFEYVAIVTAKRARGRPFVILAGLCVLTAVASALLDNVTTVLLVAPVTLLVCDQIGARPEPFLIAEAISSNIGGTATLVGDPPNIIIASRAGLTFNDFLTNLAPLVCVLLVVTLGLFRWMFSATLSGATADPSALLALDEREAIADRGLLVKCGVVLLAVVVGFVAHPLIGLEPSMVALLGAGVLVAVSRLEPADYLADVEWPTLVFFMGLFVMVGGLVETGVVSSLAEAATNAFGDNYLLLSSVVLFASGLLSGIVDNIPYVATVAPLVRDVVGAGHGSGAQAVWWALALGADLGGNATAVGASANVVVVGIAARNGHHISFWRFTRYGAVVAAVTLLVSWVYLVLRYFVLA
jgi:Na+/H+ antiporter NhaD/arsenite permease-like protein